VAQRLAVRAQPLRLDAGGDPSYEFGWPEVSLTSTGLPGCHGGSGLSGIGGSVRIGEVRGPAPIRHALKISLNCKRTCSTAGGGFRWPATKADNYFAEGYGGTQEGVKMGSLLAIPPDADLSRITRPDVRKIAEAMRTYGAYVVDDTYGPSFALNAENGPGGNMRTQFRSDYGMDFEVYASSANAWSRDLQRLRTVLAAVDNNSPTSVGGGGTPRQPLLPELVEPAATPAPTVATAPATTESSAPVPVTSTPAVPAN
jgi:hypothetical protein